MENLEPVMVPNTDESVTAVTSKELSVFVSGSFDSAAIDTACMSTVCGRKWLDRYVSSLEVGQQKEIERKHSDVTFRFGDGRKVVSDESVIITIVKQRIIETSKCCT